MNPVIKYEVSYMEMIIDVCDDGKKRADTSSALFLCLKSMR